MKRHETAGGAAHPALPTVTENGETKLRLRGQLGLTRPVFARLLNVSERTIAGAERGEREAAKLGRTYRETERICDALGELVDPKAIGPWLLAENERFEGHKPIELIERGKIDLLWDMVYRLRYGMPG
jgi:transcriptional regulator with XRE-family HTH domain